MCLTLGLVFLYADPDAEVVALSPKTLMESDRYVCEICNQGFQRDQNLQMHRRRHKVTNSIIHSLVQQKVGVKCCVFKMILKTREVFALLKDVFSFFSPFFLYI